VNDYIKKLRGER